MINTIYRISKIWSPQACHHVTKESLVLKSFLSSLLPPLQKNPKWYVKTLLLVPYKISLTWLSPHNLLEKKIQVTTPSRNIILEEYTVLHCSEVLVLKSLHPAVSEYIRMSLVLFFFLSKVYLYTQK